MIFSFDLEDWNDALHIKKDGHTSTKVFWWLLKELQKRRIEPVFYVLQDFSNDFPAIMQILKASNYTLKTHGIHHYRYEKADRKPYSWLGFTGGFYFRALPYWFVKRQIIKRGESYFHLHDFDEQHPKLKNPFMNWKRHIGLKTARKKLLRLLDEVEFAKPN